MKPLQSRFAHRELSKAEYDQTHAMHLANHFSGVPAEGFDAALDHGDGSKGGPELLGGVQKWRVRCNWKLGPVPRRT